MIRERTWQSSRKIGQCDEEKNMSTVQIDEDDVRALVGVVAVCSGLLMIDGEYEAGALEGLKRRVVKDAKASGYDSNSPQPIITYFVCHP